MTRILTISLLLSLVCGAAVLAQEEQLPSEATGVPSPLRGPVPVRVQNPLFLMFYRMTPAPTGLPELGHGEITLHSDYTSYFRVDERPIGSIAALDGELWRNALRARVGLGHQVTVSIEVPTLYGGGGFLDSFIENYHDTFNFHQEGRDENQDDQFRFLLVNDARLAYLLVENEVGLGDISFTFDWRLRSETEHAPAILLRGGLELPTGDEKRGFGNGHTDGGLGVGLEKTLGRYRLYSNVAYQIQGAPDAFAAPGVRARDNWSADLAVERPFGRRLSGLLQFGWEQSPILGTALKAVDDNAMTALLGLGWWTGGRWRLDFAFLEDLDGESAQDFTMSLAVAWRF
jgi:hypothetical protein